MAEQTKLYIKEFPDNLVVTANPWFPMNITPLLSEIPVFFAGTPEKLAQLCYALYMKNHREFLYIRVFYEPEPIDFDLFLRDGKIRIEFEKKHDLVNVFYRLY